MNKSEAMEYLRARLIRHQDVVDRQTSDEAVWWGNVDFAGRTDIEIYVADRDGALSEDHLAHAAECVASQSLLLPQLEAALFASEDDVMFPPKRKRQWCELMSLKFTAADPSRGVAYFTYDGPDMVDFIYVLYSVEIISGRAGQASAENW